MSKGRHESGSVAVKATMPEHLLVTVEGTRGTIDTADYITWKVEYCRSFGYPTVTREEVTDALQMVLNEDESLNVIGLLIQKDDPWAM